MPNLNVKRIGWVVEARLTTRYKWKARIGTVWDTKQDSIAAYSWDNKLRFKKEAKLGLARVVPVYVEVEK